MCSSRPRLIALLLGLLLGNGCQSGTPIETQPNAGDKVVTLVQDPPVEPSPLDAAAPMTLVFQVDIYQLSFPPGTYSNNDEFWNRIDEQCLDVATYDLLYRNGIRVGTAGRRELKHFEKFMDAVVPTQRFTVRATEIKNVEIEVRKNLMEQLICHFDRKNRIIGRGFDRCDNFICMSFEPAPRKPGELRLTLCPMVRAQRKHLEFNVRNEEREIAFVNPESIYDMNIRVDVPLDGILIITPSEYASRLTSVGNAFLMKDLPAERAEQVLLIIPRPYRVPDDQSKTISIK